MKKHLFHFIASITLILSTNFAFAQNEAIVLNEFDNTLLENLVNDKVNEYRTSMKLENLTRNTLLDKAALAQATDFKEGMKIEIDDDISARLKKLGSKSKADWNAIILGIAKGKDIMTYEDAAKEIASKLTTGKASQKKILMANYFYSGYSIVLDAEKKKVYVSQTLGGIDVAGGDLKKLMKTLPMKITKKAIGTTANDRDCKACEKFSNFKKLYNGIEVKGKYVYLTYDNLKELKNLLKRDNDALSIEFVMRKQYRCEGENILNASLPSRGAVVKPYTSAKIIGPKKNLAEGGDKAKSYYGIIGKIKGSILKKLPEDNEINLLVVQNGTVCKSIKRSYAEDGGQKSLTILSIFPDTAILNPGGWVPTNEKGSINFKVPFEVNKSDYKMADIKPMMDALNEPKYKINDIFIDAHSSLEGDTTNNTRLQQKRSESIMRAIQEMGKNDSNLVKPQNVTTSNGWDIWQQQVKNNKDLAYFKSMTFDEVRSNLSDPEVFKKLDTILKAQRFAGVKMNVTYDASGANEQPFVISQLKKAIEAKDGAKALKIQQFAFRKILDKKYDATPFLTMQIPTNPNFTSLIINQLFLDNYLNAGGELTPSVRAKFEELYKKSPDNGFAAFNKFMYDVRFGDFKDEKQIRETQKGIDALYATKVPQKYNDALNLEFQFKIMGHFDSVDNRNPMIAESMERIKKIFNVEGASWQNALKLGYIFAANNDLKYTTKILAPYLETKDVNPELYFVYLTAAAADEKNIFTKDFRIAMDKAKAADQSRFCKLFGAPKLSFQYLENPLIKESYCASCN
jgi:outer membrane protein OmpA-like peptidoglycan-associated protein